MENRGSGEVVGRGGVTGRRTLSGPRWIGEVDMRRLRGGDRGVGGGEFDRNGRVEVWRVERRILVGRWLRDRERRIGRLMGRSVRLGVGSMNIGIGEREEEEGWEVGVGRVCLVKYRSDAWFRGI